MIILAADTATRSCSVAICQDTALLAEITLFRRQTHSRHLLETIHHTIAMAGIETDEIDGFAVTRGPGSFTGLRIGLSCVKGLAYAKSKPVVSVSSLETLATQAAMIPLGFDFLTICPLLDARKKEVYFAGFKQESTKLIQVKPEMVLPAEKLFLHMDGRCLFIGDGAILYKDVLTHLFKGNALFVPLQHNYIRAHSIALLGYERFKSGNIDDLSALAPKYIRKSDAEFKVSTSQ
ncbi:MAG: tRNA (adenosine(37)-N6)-threonylcarbamoyltransferase complex dimerization subunit type 1 TsaB [Desulfobacterales bacterium]